MGLLKFLGCPERLGQAIAFATDKHSGQVDKQGQPYIHHCMRVLISLSKNYNWMVPHLDNGGLLDAQVAAALHDVLEDTDTRPNEVRELFGGVVANMLYTLTKQPDEIYDLYLQRVIKAGKGVLAVKMCDVADNLAFWRIDALPVDKQAYFKNKYSQAMRILNVAHDAEFQ